MLLFGFASPMAKEGFRLAILGCLCFLASSQANAQSFNCDLDEMANAPLTGGGSPSASFPGAASQAAFWNRLDAAGPVLPTTLLDLNGDVTTVQIFATGGNGTYGGFNNPNLSGDFRLLMADYAWVGQPIQYHVTGLLQGHYSVYTYGATPQGTVRNLLVSVQGSSTPTQIVSGPMPSNQFIYGLDFCTHQVGLSGNSFEIDVTTDGQLDAAIHGFQIVYTPVPEPTTVFAFSLGLSLLLSLRRMRE